MIAELDMGKKTNLHLILLVISIIFLSAVANLCLNKYYSNIFPEKINIISERIEPSWDRTVAEKLIKLSMPKWREEILDQERIIRIHAEEPAKVIEAHLKIAEIYEKKEKYEQAKEVCNKILKNCLEPHPLRKKIYLKLISIYEKEKDFAKVREINETLIQEFPDDSEVVQSELRTIGTYEKEGRYQEAIDGYLGFLDKYPKTKGKNSLAFKIGLLYRKLGKEDKANEFYKGITWDKDNIWGENIKAELWLATGQGEPRKNVIYAIKATAPPRIDGHLTEPVWEKGNKVTDFVDYKQNILVKEQTIASILYDDKNLYIAFKCLEPNTPGLVAESTTHDTDVWSDDCVEVFLDTNRDYTTYFQLIINPIKTKYDGVQLDGSYNTEIWNPKWEVATAIGENHWNVEFTISFNELNVPTPIAGEVWGLNLTRARRAGEVEISNWSFTGGNHHQPEKFGYLFFK